MYKGEKYIAIFLLLGFLFPAVYQTVHIIEHHEQKHGCSHESCNETKPGALVFQENEHCVVCDFEFTISDLPEEYDVPFIETYLNKILIATIQNNFSSEIILHTSPRAPPFFS